jgi:hypothetical protein
MDNHAIIELDDEGLQKVFTDAPGNKGHYTGAVQPLTYAVSKEYDLILGSIFQYIIRHEKKNGVEDLKKAKFYLNFEKFLGRRVLDPIYPFEKFLKSQDVSEDTKELLTMLDLYNDCRFDEDLLKDLNDLLDNMIFEASLPKVDPKDVCEGFKGILDYVSRTSKKDLTQFREFIKYLSDLLGETFFAKFVNCWSVVDDSVSIHFRAEDGDLWLNIPIVGGCVSYSFDDEIYWDGDPTYFECALESIGIVIPNVPVHYDEDEFLADNMC